IRAGSERARRAFQIHADRFVRAAQVQALQWREAALVVSDRSRVEARRVRDGCEGRVVVLEPACKPHAEVEYLAGRAGDKSDADETAPNPARWPGVPEIQAGEARRVGREHTQRA